MRLLAYLICELTCFREEKLSLGPIITVTCLFIFQPLKDKNVCTPPSKLLNDIIDGLETMPGTGSMEVRMFLVTIYDSHSISECKF